MVPIGGAEAIDDDRRVDFGSRIGSVAGPGVTLVVGGCFLQRSACLLLKNAMKGSLLGGILGGRVTVVDRWQHSVGEPDRACVVGRRLNPFLARRVV